jgi:hypothetical protein
MKGTDAAMAQRRAQGNGRNQVRRDGE